MPPALSQMSRRCCGASRCVRTAATSASQQAGSSVGRRSSCRNSHARSSKPASRRVAFVPRSVNGTRTTTSIAESAQRPAEVASTPATTCSPLFPRDRSARSVATPTGPRGIRPGSSHKREGTLREQNRGHARPCAVTRRRLIPPACGTSFVAVTRASPRVRARCSMVRRGSTVRVPQRASLRQGVASVCCHALLHAGASRLAIS